MTNYVYDKIDDAYVEKDSRTFLCSNLLRDQIEGLFEFLEGGKLGSLGFTRKDFSQTGAARTMTLDIKMFFRQRLLTCFTEIPADHQQIFDRYC